MAPVAQAAEGGTGHCTGINSCQEASDCKLAENECKGQGWVSKSVQGFGLGLRTEHYCDFAPRLSASTHLKSSPRIMWSMAAKPLHFIDRIRRDYAMVMHGVSLSIGSTDPLDSLFLRQITAVVVRVEPVWVSNHLPQFQV